MDDLHVETVATDFPSVLSIFALSRLVVQTFLLRQAVKMLSFSTILPASLLALAGLTSAANPHLAARWGPASSTASAASPSSTACSAEVNGLIAGIEINSKLFIHTTTSS